MLDLNEIKSYQNELLRYIEHPKRVIKWGKMQNDDDNKITNKVIYEISSCEEFENYINTLDLTEQDKSYCRQRYVQAYGSKVDEKMFCQHHNVFPNPNKKGAWDFNINGVEVDLKSTQFPYELVRKGEKIESYINNKEKTIQLINYYYKKQTTIEKDNSIRENYNSRLFLVHYSSISYKRTQCLKACFVPKNKIITEFCNSIDDLGWCVWSKDENSLAQVIYFVETEKGKINNKHFISFK